MGGRSGHSLNVAHNLLRDLMQKQLRQEKAAAEIKIAKCAQGRVHKAQRKRPERLIPSIWPHCGLGLEGECGDDWATPGHIIGHHSVNLSSGP